MHAYKRAGCGMISGRRRAPGLLGTCFSQIPGAQVVIGSYEAVSGTPDAPGAAEQTLLGTVQVSAPTGPYTVWAERSSGDSFTEQPARNRLLYVLNDNQLAAAESMIGEPASYIAVFTDRPGLSSAVAGAFDDNRYEWSKTEAVYSQADQNRVPKIQFVHWAMLRPLEEQKNLVSTEQDVARRLGGTLVFPVQVPRSGADREPPQSTFAQAFAQQFPTNGATPRVVDAPEAATNVQVVAQQNAAKSALGVVAVFGVGALAVWGGYELTRSMRRRPA